MMTLLFRSEMTREWNLHAATSRPGNIASCARKEPISLLKAVAFDSLTQAGMLEEKINFLFHFGSKLKCPRNRVCS
jgi:hypothetical protein